MSIRMLSEAQGYDLLERYEIPVPDYKIVNNANDALRVAEKMGYPVVTKKVSSQIVQFFSDATVEP